MCTRYVCSVPAAIRKIKLQHQESPMSSLPNRIRSNGSSSDHLSLDGSIWEMHIRQIQITCPNGCGHRYTAAGLHHHQVHDCAQRIVLCPFGCGEQVKWCDLGSEHVPSCHKAYERCNHCTLLIERNSGGHICLHRAVDTIRRILSLHKHFNF